MTHRLIRVPLSLITWTALAALAVGSPACSSGTGKQPAGSTVGARAQKSVSQSSDRSSGIFIATDRGVEEIDETGAILRRVSPTPSRRPRLLGDGSMMFMAAGFGELRQVNLDGTRERPLALIGQEAAQSCDLTFPQPWDPARFLYSDDAMIVDRSKRVVCLHLTDGTEGEKQASVWLRVELAKHGRGTVSLVCGTDPPEEDFLCQPRPASGASGKPKGDHRVDDGKLLAAGKPVPNRSLKTGSLESLAGSSSGRWALVGASVKRGKYRIRRVLVLDRQSGDLFPVRAGAWPKPLSDKQWRALDKGKDITAEAAQLSDVRALAKDDLLVVDSFLIAPGRQIVDTGGHIAK